MAITSEVRDENEAHHSKLEHPIYGVYAELESYRKLYEMLERRNLWIGRGELSSILCSIFMTHDGIENYLVTDDRKARELIKNIHNDPEVARILGFVPNRVNLTGTIGMIGHIRDLGKISQEVCHKIKIDLKNSTFRANEKLYDILD